MKKIILVLGENFAFPAVKEMQEAGGFVVQIQPKWGDMNFWTTSFAQGVWKANFVFAVKDKLELANKIVDFFGPQKKVHNIADWQHCVNCPWMDQADW